MLRLINWLSAHKAVNIVLLIVYYLLAVLPHEQVGVYISKTIRKPRGFEAYESIMFQIALGGFILYLAIVLWNVFRKKNQSTTVFYLIANTLFAVLSWYFLFVLNVEAIHFLQYATLALLMFPLIRRYGSTLFWCTLLGAIDEAYQYFYLSPDRTEYYDFNDIILDLIGAGFGLILIRSFAPKLNQVKSWLDRPIGITTLGIALLTGIMYIMGKLRFYPDPNVPDALLLVKKPPTSFWSEVPPKISFHIAEPLEGTIIVVLLLVFFVGLKRGTEV